MSIAPDPGTYPTLRTYATPQEQEQSILDAATTEFTNVGVRRANMDAVAKSAGVSRSTLYRRFANKDLLLAAVVRRIQDATNARMTMVTHGHDPQRAVVEAFCESMCSIRSDPLLRRLIDSEPEAVQSLMGVAGPVAELAFKEQATGIMNVLVHRGAKMPQEDLLIAADVMCRIAASFINTRSAFIDMDDKTQVREFATRFLAPMVW